jgi:hypothetical protein
VLPDPTSLRATQSTKQTKSSLVPAEPLTASLAQRAASQTIPADVSCRSGSGSEGHFECVFRDDGMSDRLVMATFVLRLKELACTSGNKEEDDYEDADHRVSGAV